MDKLLIVIFRVSTSTLLWLFSLAAFSQELTQSEQEAALKSAYLVNFARFVDWQDGSSSVRLCLSSSASIYQYINELEMLYVGEGRELVLIDDPESLEHCHLYYVDSNSEPLPLGESPPPGLLTITDIPKSLGKGYAVQFFVRDLKLRFAVDKELVENSSYKISSKLMRMSRRLD